MLDGNSTYGYQRVIFDIHACDYAFYFSKCMIDVVCRNKIVKWFTQFRGGPAIANTELYVSKVNRRGLTRFAAPSPHDVPV
jgi:hypothetical protein